MQDIEAVGDRDSEGLLLPGNLESQEGKMVCIVCNGKGYVIEKGKELPCQECQGRGEYLFLESSNLPNLESQERSEAHRLGAVSV